VNDALGRLAEDVLVHDTLCNLTLLDDDIIVALLIRRLGVLRRSRYPSPD
jgi:hypothetical protein